MRIFHFVCNIIFLTIFTFAFSIEFKAQNDQKTDFQKATQLYESSEYEKAVEAFHGILKKNPKDAEAYYQLGNSYFMLERFDEAVNAYEKAVSVNPRHFFAYNNMGTAYHKNLKYKNAVDAYNKAIEIKPDYPEAVFGLGAAYLELKDKENALAQQKRLNELDSVRAENLYKLIDREFNFTNVNKLARKLVKPNFPVTAGNQFYGLVTVLITIDEQGKVISANAVSGNKVLRAEAVRAAKRSLFKPTLVNGNPVKIDGVITYTFNPEKPKIIRPIYPFN